MQSATPSLPTEDEIDIQRLKRRATWAIRDGVSRVLRLSRRGRAEQAFGDPIFVVGCGHSGTTLLLSILAAHSRIHGIPYESDLAFRREGHVDWMVRRFNRETKAAGASRWVEKTPRHIQRIGSLLERFPSAKVLVIIRDGRDVACSIRDRSGDVAAGAERWVADNAAAAPFMEHPSVLVVSYEKLVEDRRSELQRVVAFLGEPFEEGLLTHHQNPFRFYGRFQDYEDVVPEIESQTAPPENVSGEDHRLYRSWQARQPVFDGRNRWKTDLSTDERETVKAIANESLRKYGYTDGDDW